MSQAFMIMHEQGRLPELIEVAEAAVVSTPGLVGYAVALGVARAELGDREVAAERLEELADRGFANLTPDVTYPVSLFLIAELIARLDARQHVDQLQVVLAPFRGTAVVVGYNAAVLGAVDRALGQLAVVDGRLDDALECFERAVELEERIGAAGLVARTRYWQARALLGGSPDQATQGREVLALALDTTRSLGTVGLAAELETLAAGAAPRPS